VAGVDGSAASTAVLDEAVAAAHRRLLPLRVIRTVSEVDTSGTVTGTRELDDLRTALAAALPATMVDVAVRTGSPEAVLTEESRTAALLLVAASSGALASPGRLDLLPAALLRSARCPVLLVRPAHGEGVVVGVDGSPRTRDVLDAAMTEACVRGTTLTVVIADGDPSTRRRAERRVADLRSGYPSVPVELRSEATGLSAALVAASRSAGLVVVGRTEDRTRSSSDTATTVAARAGCPVLVVPPAGTARAPDREAARHSAVALSWSAGQDDPAHRPAHRRQERRRYRRRTRGCS
jgi:nucleotide-binding universal stress UspA family protein